MVMQREPAVLQIVKHTKRLGRTGEIQIWLSEADRSLSHTCVTTTNALVGIHVSQWSSVYGQDADW